MYIVIDIKEFLMINEFPLSNDWFLVGSYIDCFSHVSRYRSGQIKYFCLYDVDKNIEVDNITESRFVELFENNQLLGVDKNNNIYGVHIISKQAYEFSKHIDLVSYNVENNDKIVTTIYDCTTDGLYAVVQDDNLNLAIHFIAQVILDNIFTKKYCLGYYIKIVDNDYLYVYCINCIVIYKYSGDCSLESYLGKLRLMNKCIS